MAAPNIQTTIYQNKCNKYKATPIIHKLFYFLPSSYVFNVKKHIMNKIPFSISFFSRHFRRNLCRKFQTDTQWWRVSSISLHPNGNFILHLRLSMVLNCSSRLPNLLQWHKTVHQSQYASGSFALFILNVIAAQITVGLCLFPISFCIIGTV